MFLFLLRRILLVIPVLFGLLVLTFVLTRVVPSDPAARWRATRRPAAQIAEIRAAYGFDRPLPEQFLHYLAQIAHGDLGFSYFTHRPVIDDLIERLPATLELTFAALLISVGLGIPLGVVAALNHNRWLDQLLRIFSVGGIAIASFWLALMLQLVFSMEFDLLPLRGRHQHHGRHARRLHRRLSDRRAAERPARHLRRRGRAHHPARRRPWPSARSRPSCGSRARVVLETLQKDFVTFETAIGYPRWIIIGKYVLRNSLVSTITQIGLLFGGLIAGAVVVEAIFDWPGIGGYAAGRDLHRRLPAAARRHPADRRAVYAAVNILGRPDPCLDRSARRRADVMKLVWLKFTRDRSRADRARDRRALVLVIALLAYRIAPFPEDAFSSDPTQRLRPARRRCICSAPTAWAATSLSRRPPGHPASRSGIAVFVVAASMAIGVPLGLVAGYFGGWRAGAGDARDRRVPRRAAAHPGAGAGPAAAPEPGIRDAGADP
ncbi:MAG: ABC transporter permease subunit [Pseudomonadota bacterium]